MKIKITYRREGGIAYFPGLAKPVMLDSGDLSDSDAQQLNDLLKVVESQPRSKGVLRGADMQTYVIEIQEETSARVIRLSEPVDDPDGQALVDFLEKQKSEKSAAKSPSKPQKAKKKS